MIHLILPSKRKKTFFKGQQQQVHQTTVLTQSTPKPKVGHELFAEGLRRDRVIKTLVAELPYVKGDTVRPAKASHIDKYGNDLKVVAICDSYVKYGKDEKWPDSDLPMIIHVYSLKMDTTFMCTPNWIEKV